MCSESQYRIWIPHWISKSKKINYSNRPINKEIIIFWSSESFEVKYNIGFGIPIEFPSQRKKIIQIGPETPKLRKMDLCGPKVIWGNIQYRIWNPHRISKSKKKNYSNRSINKKLDFCGPVSHLRESTISDLESP